MKPVTEPSLSEQMGDEVTFNDPLPESVGGAPMPAPKAPAPKAPAPPRKPAAQSQMTKRGVTKIAGARR